MRYASMSLRLVAMARRSDPTALVAVGEQDGVLHRRGARPFDPAPLVGVGEVDGKLRDETSASIRSRGHRFQGLLVTMGKEPCFPHLLAGPKGDDLCHENTFF